MRYWLFKSEPTCYSIDDLRNAKNQIGHWDGVRNYQVRNMLKNEIAVGDLALFYHSSCQPPGVVGVMEIIKAGYPDYTAWDSRSDHFDPKSIPDKPLWYMVDVKFVEKFKRQVTLDEMKKKQELQNLIILRKGNRLSITPLLKKEFTIICKLASI